MQRSLATAIVERDYPDRTVAEVNPIETGHRPTAVVHFDANPPLVVQLSASIDAVRVEVTLINAVRARTDVPVAPVVATGTHDGQAYAITEFRPGTDLHTTFADSRPALREALARQFGRYLGELHAAFSFEGCGELMQAPAAGDTLAAPSANCAEWVAEYGRRSVARLPSEFDALRPKLYDCLDTVVGEDVPPRLFPWDLRPGNTLVSDGRLSAVLDWERPMAAPPALSVAKITYLVADWYVDEPAPLRTAFRAGYESVRPIPNVKPVHRVVAIADTAVDARGAVTNPGYPAEPREASVEFHLAALSAALSE